MEKHWRHSIFLPLAAWLIGLLVGLGSCGVEVSKEPLFQRLTAEQTGVDFVNEIVEDDTFNMYSFMNIYTGGGIAVGDVDGDGLEDLFFSGNRVPSRLYRNKGGLQFEDITAQSGIQTSRWCAGASMVDINQDGRLDIYISVSGNTNTANLLYVNQGDGRFAEQAAAYGLDDRRQCMHASFFDYDLDGDLDVFLIVNPVDYSLADVNRIRERYLNGEAKSTDVLYRNDGEGQFTDVSAEAGILIEGYSLGLSTADINNDGWPDVYVSNDFITNDLLYINNQDGTFSNRAAEQLDHTSFAGMGHDVADINNDGWPDIMVVDMLPEDNLRKKMIIPAASYDKFQLTLEKGYEPQYTRNSLQLNNGNGRFSEIGQMAGVDKTDWSWSSLMADYDNDGDKDLLVTNGFLRDVGNLDYISYQRKLASPFGKKEVSRRNRLLAIQSLGAAKLQNYLFENSGDLQFYNRAEEWGLGALSCSNGAAFADLDGDGDLELIINNVNDQAFIYENKHNELAANKYLKLNLEGATGNRQGVGAVVRIWTADGLQHYQHHLYRGYASTVSQEIHFGLGMAAKVDSLEVRWPGGARQLLKDLAINQKINIRQADAKLEKPVEPSAAIPLFQEVSKEIGLSFVQKEDVFVDFKVQPLLPHKHSLGGPPLAVADVNGDGLDDVFVGGAAGYKGRLFLQTAQSQFEEKAWTIDSLYEDMGSLFFDAEGDGDLDLYVVSGGSSFPKFAAAYQDRLYLNDGRANFQLSTTALPPMLESGSCVAAADFDRDGDLDLFVGGRLVPGAYPSPATSSLLRNDSENGQVRFTNVTESLLADGEKMGLLTAALWTDFDGDGWQDLLVAGEWMPLQFYRNKKGQFVKVDAGGLAQSHGWWNSLQGGDFDGDGDTDYLAGNLGLNSHLKSSVEEPVCIYAKDYDKNGRIDPILCYYIKGENYVAHPRDQLIEQINGMRVRFKSYEAYARTDFAHSFLQSELSDAYVVKSQTFAHHYIENKGNGQFELHPLPRLTQMAPLYGMQAFDEDEHGASEWLLVGNSFAPEVGQGRYDASKGFRLQSDGRGGWSLADAPGLAIDGDAKSLVRLRLADGRWLFLCGRNSDASLAYVMEGAEKEDFIVPKQDDVALEMSYENGRTVRRELYYTAGYLSQSSRKIEVAENVVSIVFYNSKGQKRTIPLKSDTSE